ncbi:MAG: elongation factor G [Bacteroidota bacterium]
MKEYQTAHIKNVTLVGSSGAGKSTLAECMMFEGGVINRMGTIDDGNTISDYHEIEHERKNSVFCSIMHTEWRGTKINLLDTPGQDDFIGETIPALRISDTSLLILNAQYGVEVGTELVMRYLRKFHKPTVMVVNQVDHPKADFDRTVEQIKNQFEENIVVVQYPYDMQGEGRAIIDLLKMVMYRFPEEGGKPEKHPIPDSEKEKADQLHNELVEAAAENDDNLMELYFEKGSLDEDEMREGIRKGMLNRDMVPLFCLSAKRNMGSGRLMGFIGNVVPSAGDMAPEMSTEGKEIKTTDSATTLFVFKAANEKHAGSMSYFKVCSGEVSSGMDLINTSSNTKGRMNQLYAVDGKNRNAVDKMYAGDIGATVKFKNTFVNHTLRSADDEVQIDPIEFPEPKIRVAVVPLNQGDEEKMAMALHRIHEDDPTLLVEHSKELGQTIIQGQGELHLQTVKWTLSHIHGVEVEFIQPRISYRESIRSSAQGFYKHKKQSGGAGQYAEVYLAVQPYTEGATPPGDYKVRKEEVIELPWGGRLVFCNCIVGGVIDNRFMPAIQKGIMEVMEEGPLTGSYCRDIMVYVYDGKMHPVDSNEISFKIAGKKAFQEAFMAAKPQLQEPIYHLEVLMPDEYMGDVMTDLQGRRAMVEGIGSEGAYQKITARVPLSEMYRYSTSLSSMTQGRATFSRHFLEYSTVPGDIQAKLVTKQQAEPVT